MLLIEDSQEIIDLICVIFKFSWPEAVVVSGQTGEAGVTMVEQESPDVVILDVGLPDMSGFDVLHRIRLFSDVPVIILTGQAITEIEELKGFESGADDYLLKPFHPIQLLARVKNALAHIRTSESPADSSPVVIGNLRIDSQSHQVWVNAQALDLTGTEYNLLLYLSKNANRVLPHKDIIRIVWGENYEDTGALKMAVSRLRRKLVEAGASPETITAIKGRGYKLIPPI